MPSRESFKVFENFQKQKKLFQTKSLQRVKLNV